MKAMAAPLKKWADALVGEKAGKQSRRVIAGWRWDGRSPTIELLYAPAGRGLRDIPENVWRKMHIAEHGSARAH